MSKKLETFKDGEITTKIVVENFDKSLKKITDAVNGSLLSIYREILPSYRNSEGKIDIIGKGVSRPCKEDVYNEKLGEEIAFKKAKLNANCKKMRILRRIQKELIKSYEVLGKEMDKLDDYITSDLNNLVKY